MLLTLGRREQEAVGYCTSWGTCIHIFIVRLDSKDIKLLSWKPGIFTGSF